MVRQRRRTRTGRRVETAAVMVVVTLVIGTFLGVVPLAVAAIVAAAAITADLIIQ